MKNKINDFKVVTLWDHFYDFDFALVHQLDLLLTSRDLHSAFLYSIMYVFFSAPDTVRFPQLVNNAARVNAIGY